MGLGRRGLATLAAAAFGALAAPPARREERCWAAPGAPGGVWPTDRPVRVVCWNVQYGAGREQLFFYDGGPGVSVSAEVVASTLRGIIDTIAALAPDVVMLQEVDRRSRRTADIDEIEVLRAGIGLPYATATNYHRSPYVPLPLHEPLGHVDTNLLVLSRFPLSTSIRWQLPLMAEGWLRRQFNLRRALHEVAVPRAGGGVVRLFHTHLSAFSGGDGTLARQLATIERHLTDARDPWVLAGDFNALPPGDDPARLGKDASQYEAVSPLSVFYERYQSAVTARQHADEPERWRTWLKHGEAAPERALDHLFVGGGARVSTARVLLDASALSDHLPLVVEVVVPAR